MNSIEHLPVRTSEEKDVYSMAWRYPLEGNSCGSASTVQFLLGIPRDVEFRVEFSERSGLVVVFLKKEDHERLTVERRKKWRAETKKRVKKQIVPFTVSAVASGMLGCFIGLLSMGAFAFLGAVSEFSPDFWLAFILPAGSVAGGFILIASFVFLSKIL